MEKAITFLFGTCFWAFFPGRKLLFGVYLLLFVSISSCSETIEKSNPGETEKAIKDIPKEEQELKKMPVAEVPWMYLDDSLKNICRPLNFQLPWMASDILLLPDFVTPEILNLTPLKSFEVLDKSKGAAGDSLYYYHYVLKRQSCNCEVYRFYKGNPQNKEFDGFYISEQIVCNAWSDENSFNERTVLVGDTNVAITYEVQGHEH